MHEKFAAWRGKFINIDHGFSRYYVPTLEEEDLLEIVSEDMALEDEIPAQLEDEDAEAWTTVAVEALFSDGRFMQSEGLIAIKTNEDRALFSEEGSIYEFDNPLSKLEITLADRQSKD